MLWLIRLVHAELSVQDDSKIKATASLTRTLLTQKNGLLNWSQNRMGNPKLCKIRSPMPIPTLVSHKALAFTLRSNRCACAFDKKACTQNSAYNSKEISCKDLGSSGILLVVTPYPRFGTSRIFKGQENKKELPIHAAQYSRRAQISSNSRRKPETTHNFMYLIVT